MKYRSFVSTAMSMALALALLPFSMGWAQTATQGGVESGSQEQNRVDTEMMSHQRAMEIVLAWLQKDFAAVVQSKDGIGYVHDKAAVKAYKRDLDALRVIVNQHKQSAADYEHWCSAAFSTDYAHWCGPDVKENEMASHQQRMKDILFDLSTTFDNYVKADDHGIDQPYMVEETLDAHRDALNELADAIKDHEQDIARITVNGAAHKNTRPGKVSASIPAISSSASSHAPLPDRR